MHRHLNGLKTALLLGGLGALVVGASWLLFGRSTSALLIGLAIALVLNGVTWWRSDTIALRAMRAYPVTEQEQPELHAIVRDLAQRAGQPVPRLFLSPTDAPNAFATGRSPRKAAVCCTEGLLGLLDERELRGVLGHELMHVYNRDILTSSVAASAASALTFLAYGAMYFGGDSRRPNPIGAIAVSLLGPLAAAVVQMAISRTREFDADEDGSRLTGHPLALASALAKLEHGTSVRPLPPQRNLVNVSHVMIANPFSARGVSRLFATHPPMAERIARLRAMAQHAPPTA